MNRPMMRYHMGKWLSKMWSKLPTTARKPAIDAFLEGYEKGHAQCKFEMELRQRFPR